MWVIDHLDDIDSDMSVFHRVDDARTTLPAPLYFDRALRLSAYQGVMQARVLAERERERQAGSAGYSPRALGGQPPAKVKDDVLLERLAGEGWIER